MPPPDDAYSRVTNPERFAVLHDVVRTIIDELAATYDVDVEGLVVVPRLAGAATLTFTLTDFPGVRLVAGRHFDGHYPQCGCDACDEQPDDVAAELRWHVEAITGGGFAEESDGAGWRRSLDFGGRRSSSWSLDKRSSDQPWSIRWAAWPPAPG